MTSCKNTKTEGKVTEGQNEGKENNHGDGNEVASTNEAYQHKSFQ